MNSNATRCARQNGCGSGGREADRSARAIIDVPPREPDDRRLSRVALRRGRPRACCASVTGGGERKVRTPQGSAPGNARSGQPEGQWHRKHTADVGCNGRPLPFSVGEGLWTVPRKGEKVR